MSLFGPPKVEKLSAERNVGGLVKALRYKEDKAVREAAAKALREIGDARAVEPLITALEDENWDVRRAAAWALRRIGDARAVEPLITALKSSQVRKAAATALGDLGDARAVEPLIATLTEERSRLGEDIAEALGKIGDARAVEALIAALKHEEWHVRVAAATALGDLGDARAVEPLSTALEDESQDVRKAAAAVFGQRGWEPDCTVWVERLRELPITPPGNVPKSTHPNRVAWDDDDRTDPVSFAKFLANNSFRYSREGGIAAFERGGGCSTSYDVYRTAESAWRVVETAEYYD